MITRNFSNQGKVNVTDFLLLGIAAMTGVFSGGQALLSATVSVVGIVGVGIGIAMSYLFRTLLEDKILLKADWFFYTIVIVTSVVFVRTLNTVFPEETFPRELMPCAWLYWMLIFGSFFVWTDRTLLFHAIPALAMFGFVGCYDTFRPVIFFFFIYLVSFATLFARAHARDMQSRALASGFFGGDKVIVSQPGRQLTMLKEGPWRWAAGPEWALWSALGIVLLSLLGAPVVRSTVKPISGAVRLGNPLTARIASQARGNTGDGIPNTTRVGTGPVNLREIPVFDVMGEGLDPFRVMVYDFYNGQGWERTWDGSESYVDEKGEYVADGYERVFKNLENARTETITVVALKSTQEVLQRGMDPVVLSGPTAAYDRSDTLYLRRSQNYPSMRLQYTSTNPRMPGKGSAPKIIGGNLKSALDVSNFAPAVVELARKEAGNKGSDFEKAERLRRYIAKTIVYNTQAKAIPANADPVEYVLTQQKEAYCDLFASSMVQMARAINIPARYAVGYLPNPESLAANGHMILREADRHAWAELFFAGRGWVVFDATEGAREVPGGERVSNKERKASNNRLLIAVGVSVIILAGGIVLLVWLARREQPKKNPVKTELDKLAVNYQKIVWETTGRRRQLGETLWEYHQAVSDNLPGGKTGSAAEASSTIANEFSNLYFSPVEATPEQMEAMKASISTLRTAVKEETKAAKALAKK